MTALFHHSRCEGVYCHEMQRWLFRRTDMAELVERLWRTRAERADQASQCGGAP
jgi:hypothetical protein